MLRRKARSEAVEERASDAAPVEVTEIVPTEGRRACPKCHVLASLEDAFCTACGAELPPVPTLRSRRADVGAETEESAPPLVLRSPISSAEAFPPNKKPRGRRLGIAAATILLIGMAAAIAVLAFAWRSERHHKLRAEASLASALSSYHSSQAKLHTSETLVSRQHALLAQTAAVLRRVDPLLSDTDRLQQVTSQIETARNTFSADSQQAMSDAIYLENYEANPQNYPGVDEAALVNQVNSELNTVRADSATLTSFDGRYTNASNTFSRDANALVTAVRRLQRELQSLPHR